MHGKNLVVDGGGDSQKVEHIHEVLPAGGRARAVGGEIENSVKKEETEAIPDVGIAILLLALGVEAVGERNGPRFVIASEQVYCMREGREGGRGDDIRQPPSPHSESHTYGGTEDEPR
jgi:hypothetical protein